MLINKRFGVYQISFDPPPKVSGVYSSFDTLEKAQEHINVNKNDKIGDAWIILKRKDIGNGFELVQCLLIDKK